MGKLATSLENILTVVRDHSFSVPVYFSGLNIEPVSGSTYILFTVITLTAGLWSWSSSVNKRLDYTLVFDIHTPVSGSVNALTAARAVVDEVVEAFMYKEFTSFQTTDVTFTEYLGVDGQNRCQVKISARSY